MTLDALFQEEAAMRANAHIITTILDDIDEGGLSIRETLRYLRTIILRLTPTPHRAIVAIFDALKDVVDGTAPPFVPPIGLFTTPPHSDSTVRKRTAGARALGNAMFGVVGAAAGTALLAWGAHGFYLTRPRPALPCATQRVAHIRALAQEAQTQAIHSDPKLSMFECFFDAFQLQGDDRAAAQAAALAGAWNIVYAIIRNPTRPTNS